MYPGWYLRSMHLILLLLFLSVPRLLSNESTEESTRQLIIETARTLLITQYPDGGWSNPDDWVRTTVMAPPQAVGSPPPPTIASEDRYRFLVRGLCAGAEGLWLVQDIVPESATAATRAQDLAARALLANPTEPVNLREAIVFLRAEKARGTKAQGLGLLVAERCQQVLMSSVVRVNNEVIGVTSKNGDSIDLRQTWLASNLLPNNAFSWEIPGDLDVSARIARFQPFRPVLRTNGSSTIAPPCEFEDATPFATLIYQKESWLRAICEQELVPSTDPERLFAFLEIFCRPSRAKDANDVWWRQRIALWTESFIHQGLRGNKLNHWNDGKMKQISSDPVFVWAKGSELQEYAQGFGLRWLATLLRIQIQNREEQEYAQRNQQIVNALKQIAKYQEKDGSWKDMVTGDDITALVCCAFFKTGYDHTTKSDFQKTVAIGISFLSQTSATSGSVFERAMRTIAFANAFDCTQDENLLRIIKKHVKSLEESALPSGGWPTKAGGILDWETSALTVHALRMAKGIGIDVSFVKIIGWWNQTVGSGEQDVFTTLAAKTAMGLFLGEETLEQRRVLSRHLASKIPKELTHPRTLWFASFGFLFGDQTPQIPRDTFYQRLKELNSQETDTSILSWQLWNERAAYFYNLTHRRLRPPSP